MQFAIAQAISLCALFQPVDKSALPADHAKRFEIGGKLFASKVAGVLKAQCLPCHGGEKIRGGFNLATREKMLEGGDSGPAVIPFNADKSRLINMVRHKESPAMPEKGPPLPKADQDALTEWVNHGAPYGEPLLSQGTMSPKPRTISEKDRQFRSFRPLASIQTPMGDGNPVDYFINRKLKELNLQPGPVADKRVLARRAFIDLVGIPPTMDQLRAFIDDNSPDAYARMIDRLLASPQYGERWARHWLDVARYAESHGYEQDYDRQTAYTFRDFVIRALNDDLPYDTFLKWQVAGDEIAPENAEAWFATGFLAAGVHATQITISQVEKERYDELDDIARTIGASMLGLSIQCARCHDHKYDPIPTRDYYRFISIFTKTVRSEKEIPIPDPGMDQKIKDWENNVEKVRRELVAREGILDQEFTTWLTRYLKSSLDSPWTGPISLSAKSGHGSTVDPEPAGTIKVRGNNPTHERIEISASTPLSRIQRVRIEALASPDLPKNGPGRAANGNFALSNLNIQARPTGTQSPWKTLQLTNPRATFEQASLPVSAVIDGDLKSAWAIDPQFGRDHAAMFTIAHPVDSSTGWDTRWVLEFNNNTGHGMGDIRISFSGKETGDLRGMVEPGFAHLLRKEPSKPLSPMDASLAKATQRSQDPEWTRLSQLARSLVSKRPAQPTLKALVSSEGLPAVRLHTQGGDFLEQTHFLKRGDPNQKGAVATPSFLEILTANKEGDSHWLKPAPPNSRTPMFRKALAEWITDTRGGAGNLAARVAVNRMWHHHFGRGLVRTINDFGTTGDNPSHPDLLEWLAGHLVASNWRLKAVHKTIMTSDAYKRANQPAGSGATADLENRWLAGRNPRRLEAEAARDSLLAVAGILDARQFGPSESNPLHHRRSIYTTLKRSRMPSMMTLFDAPDSLQSAEERPTTTVAPQALMLMNHPLLDHVSRGLVSRAVSSGKDPVESLFEIVLLRPPSEGEKADARRFFALANGESKDKTKGLRELGQALALSNEFFYVD